MSTQLAPVDRVIRTIEQASDQLAAAWPGGPGKFSHERFHRVATTVLRGSPGLSQCDPTALLSCLVRLAQTGLYPDAQIGHAYIIPYGRTPTLVIGYRGLVELARRSGEILSLTAEVVCKQDSYKVVLGTSPRIEHEPAPGPRTADTIVAAYAVARIRGGGCQFEWLDRTEIDRIRRCSKSGDSGPWAQHYGEMARKTAVRRLCKLLPLSLESQSAIAAMDAEERLDDVQDGRHTVTSGNSCTTSKTDPLAAYADAILGDDTDDERRAIQAEANGA